MRAEYWKPAAVADLPFVASPSVRETRTGLSVVNLTVGATNKGDRAFGFIENNYPEMRPQSRTDTSHEEALLTHPLRIARHKATSFRTENNEVAFADDVARIIDGEIRYKPNTVKNTEELITHLCKLLCDRPSPLIMEIVNAQALHGRKGNVSAVDRFHIEFDSFSPQEVEYYVNGLNGLSFKEPEAAAQLQAVHQKTAEAFAGILTAAEIEQFAQPKQFQILKKVIDGILLEDPLFQRKILRINGKDKRDREFSPLLREVFEASLGLPVRLRQMVYQYHTNANASRELLAFPVNNSAGYVEIDERTLSESDFVRSQAIGPHASRLGYFELQGKPEEKSIEIQRFYSQPDLAYQLWQYLLTIAELTATEKGYSGLKMQANSNEARFLQAQGFQSQGNEKYVSTEKSLTRVETYTKRFDLGTR